MSYKLLERHDNKAEANLAWRSPSGRSLVPTVRDRSPYLAAVVGSGSDGGSSPSCSWSVRRALALRSGSSDRSWVRLGRWIMPCWQLHPRVGEAAALAQVYRRVTRRVKCQTLQAFVRTSNPTRFSGLGQRHRCVKAIADAPCHLVIGVTADWKWVASTGPADRLPFGSVNAPSAGADAPGSGQELGAPVARFSKSTKTESPGAASFACNSGAFGWSGRLDLNQRPLAPQRWTGLKHLEAPAAPSSMQLKSQGREQACRGRGSTWSTECLTVWYAGGTRFCGPGRVPSLRGPLVPGSVRETRWRSRLARRLQAGARP